MSYIAQISVSDGQVCIILPVVTYILSLANDETSNQHIMLQVDHEDFTTLAELITALKASSMSSLRLANCGLTSEVAGDSCHSYHRSSQKFHLGHTKFTTASW